MLNWKGLCTKDGDLIPLKKMDIRGEADGLWFTMKLTQEFENSGTETVETVYTFPVARGVTVTEFAAVTGGKRLVASALRKEAAETKYEKAVESGDMPVMLEYREEEGLCTANIGTLCPGERVTLEISTARILSASSGSVRIAVPTVAGERYSADGTQGALPPQAELTYSATAEYPLTVSVLLSGGLEKGAVSVPGWKAAFEKDGENLRIMAKGFADRDFVIHVERAEIAPRLITAKKDGHVYAAAWTLGGAAQTAGEPRPLSLTILADCSGSMSGCSIGQVRDVCRVLAESLSSEDRIALYRFGTETIADIARPVPCSKAGKEKFLAAAGAMDADLGGTDLENALKTVLETQKTEDGDILIVTDGQIFSGCELLQMARASGRRIFTLGVGLSPRDDLISNLAETTGGFASYVFPGEDLADTVFDQTDAMRCGRAPASEFSWPGDALWSGGRRGNRYAGHSCFSAAILTETVSASVRSDDGAEPVPASGKDYGAALVKFAADQLLKSGDAKDPEKVAVSHGLLSRYTNLILVAERAEGEKADSAPALVQVPQMENYGSEACMCDKPMETIRRSPSGSTDLFSCNRSPESLPKLYSCGDLGMACADLPPSYQEPSEERLRRPLLNARNWRTNKRVASKLLRQIFGLNARDLQEMGLGAHSPCEILAALIFFVSITVYSEVSNGAEPPELARESEDAVWILQETAARFRFG